MKQTSRSQPAAASSYETPAELADRVGLPVSNIRYLIRARRLDHIYTSPGKRNPKIPPGAWERYVERFMVRADCALSDQSPGAEISSKGETNMT